VTKGDLTRSIQVEARGEVAELKDNINAMIGNLRLTTDRNNEQDWLKTNLAKFTRMMQGQRDLFTVGQMLLSELASLVNAQQGAIYQLESEDSRLRLLAGYAHRAMDGRDDVYRLGEGLVGQCGIEKKRLLLSNVPADSIRIASGSFEASPRSVVVLPVLFEGESKAVIELASMEPFHPSHLLFLDQLTESIGIVLNTIEATMRTEGLLKQSQALAGELQSQQKELQQTNEQLALKAQQLAEQNAEVERKNQEIEQARRALEEKATELALTSKYKSEFLANMSHELRTPLNSILILGQQLSENSLGNLSEKQVEFAKTIHGAGTDLLNLISDILDLSKIESGTVTVDCEDFPFLNLNESVDRMFRHETENRRVGFTTNFDSALARSMVTDPKRLLQVLKNLLSNAFKFTEQGEVSLTVKAVASGWTSGHPILDTAPVVVAFEVRDTGIGIPPDKQRIIFEAFQQADAGTSRKYGGTGLGLAISRELANLLGGEIRLQSQQGKGSTFTLYLPLKYVGPTSGRLATAATPAPPPVEAPVRTRFQEHQPEQITDDRDKLSPGDPVLLIVEDDPHFARVLLGIANDKGFKGIVAQRGSVALTLARQYMPTAISLDIFLPDMLGWTVLNQLKRDPSTRHIPIQIMTVEEERQHGLEHGAFAYMVKPITTDGLEVALEKVKRYASRDVKRLLIVEDNEAERMSVVELLAHDDVEIRTAATGAEALAALRSEPYDGVVLDLRLPDTSGFDLLEKLQADAELRDVPVIVFTGKELSQQEEDRLRVAAKSIVIKGVQSPERLLDETALFLHRVVTNLPVEKQRMLERLHQTDEALEGKKVLVVDDDVRNIFALSSVLERHGMKVVTANTGKKAINTLESTTDVSIVLMDIMMPEMDGYETMDAIRQKPELKRLPILALTAKAMKGDREKCLQAGASDYIAKPVNTDQLLSLMRVWLHQ
jgi:CheY-like chemotaxis protein/signal transduction histidine kinase